VDREKFSCSYRFACVTIGVRRKANEVAEEPSHFGHLIRSLWADKIEQYSTLTWPSGTSLGLRQIGARANCLANISCRFLILVVQVFIDDECCASELISASKAPGPPHFSNTGHHKRIVLRFGRVIIVDVL
jgi:hypothetical protein